MSPEWFALTGLFLMVVGLDYRQTYETKGRCLYHWALCMLVGVGLFIVGAWQAVHR